MLVLSGFGDEISPDLDEQIDTLRLAGIDLLDLRGVWGRNVLDLSDTEIGRIRETLADHGMRVSCVARSVGQAYQRVRPNGEVVPTSSDSGRLLLRR